MHQLLSSFLNENQGLWIFLFLIMYFIKEIIPIIKPDRLKKEKRELTKARLGLSLTAINRLTNWTKTNAASVKDMVNIGYNTEEKLEKND